MQYAGHLKPIRRMQICFPFVRKMPFETSRIFISGRPRLGKDKNILVNFLQVVIYVALVANIYHKT